MIKSYFFYDLYRNIPFNISRNATNHYDYIKLNIFILQKNIFMLLLV